jgi:hypothetical protein
VNDPAPKIDYGVIPSETRNLIQIEDDNRKWNGETRFMEIVLRLLQGAAHRDI